MKIIFRKEPGYLTGYNLTTKKTVKISPQNLEQLNEWLQTGTINDFTRKLVERRFIRLEMTQGEKENLKLLIHQCHETKAPLRSLSFPEIMNIELTSRCPLRCPHCYCDLTHGKDINKEVAFQYIDQAARLKIPFINLSGGETLVYPHLMDLLKYINSKGLDSAIAISGWGFNQEKLVELKAVGVGEIYVSLNGSTEKVNALSRDGYQLAIHALRLLQADQGVDYYINWVARNDNIEDFPNLVRLAKNFRAKGIYVLVNNPDANHLLQSILTQENFLSLANYIKKHDHREITITVEPCFSPLRAYISNYFFMNTNTGVNKGCGAGRNAMAVDVNGEMIPCRHLLYPEKYESIADYWRDSEVLKQLRSFEDNQGEPCSRCYLKKNCVSCRAVADKVDKNYFSGDHYCPVKNIEKPLGSE